MLGEIFFKITFLEDFAKFFHSIVHMGLKIWMTKTFEGHFPIL